jgi:ethanolamine utilization protein EutN
MFLGRVTGRLWSSIKNPGLEAQRLLVVQPVNPAGEPVGKPLVCTDSTGAGAGELIYWVRGREASFPFQPVDVPSDATIVGIVDEIHLGKPKPPTGA